MLARRGFVAAATTFLLAPLKVLLGDTLNRAAVPKFRTVTHQEEQVVRQFYEVGWNLRNKAEIDKHPEAAASCAKTWSMVGAVFAVVIAIVEIVADGDFVVVRWRADGTHKGEYKGIAPTSRRVSVTGRTKMKIVGGKIVSIAAEWDENDLMRQLRMPAQTATPRRLS